MNLNQDNFLDELRKPLYFADEEEENTEDLFTEEGLSEEELEAQAAAEAEEAARAAAEAEALAKEAERAASLRLGIRRSLTSYALLVLAGIFPLALIIFYMLVQKLSTVATWWFILFLVGWIFSIYNLMYYSKNQDAFYSSFDLKTFFTWKEIVVISIILISISFINLINLSNNTPLSLSAKSFIYNSETQIEEEDEEEIAFKISAVRTKNSLSSPSPSPKPIPKKEKSEEIILVPAVGAVIGVLRPPPPTPEPTPTPVDKAIKTIKTRPLPDVIKTWFLEGALAGPLGYAFPLAIAGAIFALFRPFNTPFSNKTIERVNLDTGEIITETETKPITTQIFNYIFKFLIGFSFGGTLGFILGIVIILPLYFLFSNSNNLAVINFVSVLGVVKNPDLSYTYGIIVSGFLIPLILLFIAKLSPVGLSVTESKLKETYAISVPTPVQTSVVPAKIPEPVAIVFDGLGELDSEEVLNELNLSDESIASEVLGDYADELKKVFGLEELPIEVKGNGKKQIDKAKIAAIIEESFGEMSNVPVEISAELGHAVIELNDWLNLTEGTIIELDKAAGDDVDILFNGIKKGKGKLTLVDNHLAIEVSNSEFTV